MARRPVATVQVFPAGFPEADRARLTDRAKRLYASAVAPAFQKLREYLVATYIPACRDSIAASALPNGAATYAFRVRSRPRQSYAAADTRNWTRGSEAHPRGDGKLIAATGFKGSFPEFTEFLRTDPRFTTTSRRSGERYRIIAKRMIRSWPACLESCRACPMASLRLPNSRRLRRRRRITRVARLRWADRAGIS